MALLLIELVDSFAIAIRHCRRVQRLRVSMDSALYLILVTSASHVLAFTIAIRHFTATGEVPR